MKHVLSKIIVAMLFSAMLLSFASCKDNGTEMPIASVEIVPGEVTESTLSFSISSSDADVVRYSVTAASEAEPTVEDIFKNGNVADATASKTYTADGLVPNTAYRIMAVAQNESGYSEPSVITMTTAEAEQKIPATVKLEAGTATTNAITFKLSPKDAVKAAYTHIEKGAALPDAAAIIANGQSADASAAKDYEIKDLKYGTTYVVVAAAEGETGLSEVASIEMTTSVPVPSVSLEAGESTHNSLSFTMVTADAAKAAYVCLEKDEIVPAAESILSSGTAVEAGKSVVCTVNDLTAETEYVIVAAVNDLTGGNPVVSEILSMTTGAAPVIDPKVGDFYYSDGTWSTELDESKTPIGLVFYVGEATDYKDRASFYKQKDGVTAMSEIRGYVIALKDATLVDGYNEGVWWSFFDSRYEGTTSCEQNDFLGYTNTKSIVAAAEQRDGLADDYKGFPATYYATEKYESVCPAPETSSGWFLPSVYQFKYIYDNVYFNASGAMSAWLEKSFEALGDKAEPMYVRDSEYWTSTEKYDSNGYSTWAYYFSFDSSQFNPGFISDYRKNSYMRVRSVLVF